MNLTEQHKKELDWPTLIKSYRLSLEMTGTEFGKLYEVTKQTVSFWETGRNEAPYSVTWDILQWLEGKEAK